MKRSANAIHRADYRGHLHALADQKRLREEIERKVLLLQSCQPINKRAEFILTKSAALDLLDLLAEVERRQERAS